MFDNSLITGAHPTKGLQSNLNSPGNCQKIYQDNLDYILVIDSSSKIRIQISGHLGNQIKVNYVSSGKEAISFINKRKIDLIVTDGTMPEMDGIKFSSYIKSHTETRHIPIIILLESSSPNSLIAAINAGIDTYLFKPFDRQVLLIQIKSLLLQRKRLYEDISRKIFLQKKAEVESLDHLFLKRVKAIVELNISEENFTMEKLAENLMISRSQLHRKIKLISGVTTTEYVNWVRVTKAVELITTEKCYFNEIAFRVGYSSQSYFTKCFKKVYNVTPKEYFSSNCTR